MTQYLLDSNACIRHLNGRASNLTARLKTVDPNQLAVCSVVKAELFFGSARSQNPTKSRQVQDEFLNGLISLPFDDAEAEQYAHIRANLTTSGTLIGPNDLLIAAIALANNRILVTNNTDEFGRVKGLRLEDWELSPQA